MCKKNKYTKIGGGIRKVILLALVCILTLTSVSGCSKENTGNEDAITVALFPYVPDVEAMQNILTEMWSKVSDTPITFVKWDCYYDESPDNIDVFMYDALFLDYLAEAGYTTPIKDSDIDDIDGLVDCTVEGARYNGELHGIPALMCSNFLFYYTDDTEIAQVENVQQLYDIIGDSKTGDRKPADSSYGMVVNFYDDLIYLYLEALVDEAGEALSFSESPNLDHPNMDAIKTMNQFAKMSGQQNVLISTLSDYVYGSFGKSEWFNDGHGRVFFGYSENMAFMPDIIDKISLKQISMAEKENIQIFYSDLVSINKKSVTDKSEYKECLKLANLMASEDFLKELVISNGKTPYLLLARESVYDYAAEVFPVYTQLKELATAENNTICRFGTDIYDYIKHSLIKISKHFK